MERVYGPRFQNTYRTTGRYLGSQTTQSWAAVEIHGTTEFVLGKFKSGDLSLAKDDMEKHDPEPLEPWKALAENECGCKRSAFHHSPGMGVTQSHQEPHL